MFPVKCLPLPGEELSIVLMCVVPLVMPILRSVEHIRNFMSPVFEEDMLISLMLFIVEDM